MQAQRQPLRILRSSGEFAVSLLRARPMPRKDTAKIILRRLRRQARRWNKDYAAGGAFRAKLRKFQHKENLLEPSGLLAAIVASSTDAVIGKTLGGTVVSWNKAAVRLFGYSQKEMLGRNIRCLIPPGRQSEEDVILACIAEGQTIKPYETVRLHKDGHGIDVSVTVSPIRNADGAITGASKIVRDISDQKLAGERLRKSEADFRAAFENAAVGMAFVAPGGAWLSVNACLCEITGYSQEELLTKTFQDITHPEDLPPHLLQVRRMLRGEIGRYQTEMRYLRKDGWAVWVRLTAGAVREPDGAIGCLICVIENISDRKSATDDLRESEERYRSIVSTAIDAIIIIDESGIIQSINPAGEAMFGYDPSELEGRNVAILMPEPDSSRHNEYISAYLKTGNPKIIGRPRDLDHLRKDGSVFRAELTLTEWRVGGKRNFTATIHDITERKRYEDKIKLLLREVNHRAKNMLGLVQSVARQTVAATPTEFMQRFSARIQSLAASQDLIVKNEWVGVQLGELARSQLAHFQDLIGIRIEIRGPPIAISAQAAQTIGIALHELATNAGKYGALSTPEGSVEICWGLGNGEEGADTFMMEWRERGGPVITTVPARSGFGSLVLTRLAMSSLDAKAELGFPEAGLRWRLECQASEVLEREPSASLSSRDS